MKPLGYPRENNPFQIGEIMLQELTTYLGVDTRAVLEIGFFAIMLLFMLITSFHSSRRAFWRGRWMGERDERISNRIERISQGVARTRNRD